MNGLETDIHKKKYSQIEKENKQEISSNSYNNNRNNNKKFGINSSNQLSKNYLKSWLIKNLKLILMRAVYVLFKNKSLLIKAFRNISDNFLTHFQVFVKSFLSSLVSISSFRFMLSISLISLLNRLVSSVLNKYNKISFFNKNYDIRVMNKYLSFFIAFFISILISERSEITNYLIISSIIRVIHQIISNYLKERNILQIDCKLYSFIMCLIPCSMWFFIMYWHPSFTSITGPVDAHCNLDAFEKMELAKMRSIMRLV